MQDNLCNTITYFDYCATIDKSSRTKSYAWAMLFDIWLYFRQRYQWQRVNYTLLLSIIIEIKYTIKNYGIVHDRKQNVQIQLKYHLFYIEKREALKHLTHIIFI